MEYEECCIYSGNKYIQEMSVLGGENLLKFTLI